MEKEQVEALPTYSDAVRPWHKRRRRRRTIRLLAAVFLAYFAISAFKIARNTTKPASALSTERLREDHATCTRLRTVPVEPKGTRDQNKRWVKGTKPVLIRNATIWTGEPAPGTSAQDARAGKGWEWINADIFIDHGLIKAIGENIEHLPPDTTIFEARGRQLTSGIVDMHSHAGLGSVGNLQDDVNELSKDITPFVRSLDGLDPLQPEFDFIKSGGVTTSLILPGSGNNMGGEAFVVKFAVGDSSGRAEISQQDMLAAPDAGLRWMKMACGENPKRVYGIYGKQGPFSRLGEAWEFRHALEHARNYVRSQDEWCAAADAAGAVAMTTYLPQELKWESLGAVLRGQVRVNAHCYTIPDLEAFVRHTNEFKFRLYAFHHAHQTYLIPEVLKRTYGGTPAVALFADNMYYKVEAYTASEKAGKIAYEAGITPTYVSDNPVLNSQHVVFEAAKAYGYGLPYHAALAGVTSAPAMLLGLGERIGKVKASFDADIVLWDSDPLSVGATPVQVWIDGAPQFQDPVELEKPLSPPIKPESSLAEDLAMSELPEDIIFTGISHDYVHNGTNVLEDASNIVAIVKGGSLSCVGFCKNELLALEESGTRVIQVRDGHITPPFTAFGSALGLIEIDAEGDTQDGSPPKDGITRAVDGLQFGGKQLARAYEHGVAKAISAPTTYSIESRGVSAGFKSGAKNALEKGAVWQDEVALHFDLTLGAKNDKSSISNAIGSLRAKLLDAVYANKTEAAGKAKYEEKAYLKRVVESALPLVLSVHSADTIAAVIRLKAEIESVKSSLQSSPKHVRLIIVGGAESHLVAGEIAAAGISVVLAPLLPHAQSWDQRRGLTGAPLTNGTAIDALISAGVTVGIGVEELWETRDLGLLAGIAYANSEGKLGFKEALDLVGANFDRMLDIDLSQKGLKSEDWVIWEGSPLQIGGRVRAVGGLGRTSVWI
ncbi:amidohydrolase [Lophiotrema nucula]|uniref:Amidohydrolase n=1 Tax=Lophiotrema nucula TaxID=690887 RepID=A0A6A5ZLE3_9PLEO|nr:amidohydrolase [Lophiotrema nucula]